jgi:hypothetical protein
MDEFDLFGVEETEEDKKYTTKVGIPQYLPSPNCPRVDTLVDKTKYNELIREINASNVSEADKEFLRLAATRHLVFTYSRIADYYAHAGKEMQGLMEKSALVIIDINDAIANGYVKLSKSIEDIMNKTGRKAGDDYHNQTTPATDAK